MTFERRPKSSFLRSLSLCLVASAVAVAAFPIRAGQDTPRPGGTLRVRPFSDDVRPNLDPASGVWIFATEQIFDGLVAIDADLTPVPGLAEYWKVEDEGRRMLFYLRKGSRFHNGREVTSEDVKFSFERLLRPEVGSPFYDYFASRVAGARDFREGKATDVSGFRAPAPDVFEIRLVSPFVSALPILGMSFAKVLPKDLVQDQGRNFFFRPVGSGAFIFDSWMRSPRLDIVGVRLERNPRYFGKKPFVSVLEISPHFNDEHFRNRELDICPFWSEDLAEAGCKVLSSGPRSITLLAMSCRNSPLDRPSVRRAIARALDKEALARTGENLATVSRATDNFIPPLWPGFFPRDAVAAAPEKSRQVLEDQGFFLEKEFPQLLLFIPAGRDNRDHQMFAREAARELGLIGISVAIRTYQTPGDLKDLRQPFLAKIDWALDVPDPETILRLLFHSRSDINGAVSGYASAELDKLLEEAGAEKSATRRNELLRRAEAVLFEDLPAFPVTMNEQRLAVQPYVRGVRVPPLGFAYLDTREIWLDKKESPR
jgi:ABC-type transport system substrate-binding protein